MNATKLRFHIIILCSVILNITSPLRGIELSLEDGGIRVSDQGGKFVVSYPVLLDGEQNSACKLIEVKVDSSRANLKYDDSSEAEVSVEAGKLLIRFIHVSMPVQSFRVGANLGFTSLITSHWKADGGDLQAFPEQKPDKPHLLEAQVRKLDLVGFMGRGLSIGFPALSLVQVTDCREWGWKNFGLSCILPINPSELTYTFEFSESAEEPLSTAAPRKVLIDKFGQYTAKDWPSKVKSEDELKADVEADKEYYSSLQPPSFDPYGGLPGTKEKFGFMKTGFYHLEKKGGRYFLVDPDGNWFFHLGVCAFQSYTNSTYFKGREDIYEWIPSTDSEFRSAFGQNGGGTEDGQFNYLLANRIRKYGRPFDFGEYTAQMIERVRKFGFNSTGAFGHGDMEAKKKANFPYVTSLPITPEMGIPFFPGIRDLWDPFDEKTRLAVEEKLRTLAARAGDPLLIGYYLANEPLYENIPKTVAGLKEDHACKRQLIRMLEQKYKTVSAFNKAWNVSFPSFVEASRQGLPVSTPAASKDMDAFRNLFLEEYFRFVTGLIRKYDPNHLILGCRLQYPTMNSESLCRIGGKYVDIWSFNYYTYGIDEDFLQKVYAWSGKPMFLSEFYWNSFADSGVAGGVKDVSSQQERGLAYRNYVEHAASLPFIVGVEWFTLVDASQTGVGFAKYNGENPNSGLISVADRPWKPMIAEMIKTNYGIYKVAAGEQERFVYDDPKFRENKSARRNSVVATKVAQPLKIDGQGGDWPGMPAEGIGPARLVEGKSADGFEAAFKLAWDNSFLYILADVNDPTPMRNEHPGPALWNADGIELFIGSDDLGKSGTLLFTDRQVLLSASANGPDKFHHVRSEEQLECKVSVAAKAGEAGYILEAAIPWNSLSCRPQSNKELLFDVAVDDSLDGKRRDKQIMWNGTTRNSGDRTNWGRVRLTGQ